MRCSRSDSESHYLNPYHDDGHLPGGRHGDHPSDVGSAHFQRREHWGPGGFDHHHSQVFHPPRQDVHNHYHHQHGGMGENLTEDNSSAYQLSPDFRHFDYRSMDVPPEAGYDGFDSERRHHSDGGPLLAESGPGDFSASNNVHDEMLYRNHGHHTEPGRWESCPDVYTDIDRGPVMQHVRRQRREARDWESEPPRQHSESLCRNRTHEFDSIWDCPDEGGGALGGQYPPEERHGGHSDAYRHMSAEVRAVGNDIGRSHQSYAQEPPAKQPRATFSRRDPLMRPEADERWRRPGPVTVTDAQSVSSSPALHQPAGVPLVPMSAPPAEGDLPTDAHASGPVSVPGITSAQHGPAEVHRGNPAARSLMTYSVISKPPELVAQRSREPESARSSSLSRVPLTMSAGSATEEAPTGSTSSVFKAPSAVPVRRDVSSKPPPPKENPPSDASHALPMPTSVVSSRVKEDAVLEVRGPTKAKVFKCGGEGGAAAREQGAATSTSSSATAANIKAFQAPSAAVRPGDGPAEDASRERSSNGTGCKAKDGVGAGSEAGASDAEQAQAVEEERYALARQQALLREERSSSHNYALVLLGAATALLPPGTLDAVRRVAGARWVSRYELGDVRSLPLEVKPALAKALADRLPTCVSVDDNEAGLEFVLLMTFASAEDKVAAVGRLAELRVDTSDFDNSPRVQVEEVRAAPAPPPPLPAGPAPPLEDVPDAVGFAARSSWTSSATPNETKGDEVPVSGGVGSGEGDAREEVLRRKVQQELAAKAAAAPASVAPQVGTPLQPSPVENTGRRDEDRGHPGAGGAGSIGKGGNRVDGSADARTKSPKQISTTPPPCEASLRKPIPAVNRKVLENKGQAEMDAERKVAPGARDSGAVSPVVDGVPDSRARTAHRDPVPLESTADVENHSSLPISDTARTKESQSVASVAPAALMSKVAVTKKSTRSSSPVPARTRTPSPASSNQSDATGPRKAPSQLPNVSLPATQGSRGVSPTRRLPPRSKAVPASSTLPPHLKAFNKQLTVTIPDRPDPTRRDWAYGYNGPYFRLLEADQNTGEPLACDPSKNASYVGVIPSPEIVIKGLRDVVRRRNQPSEKAAPLASSGGSISAVSTNAALSAEVGASASRPSSSSSSGTSAGSEVHSDSAGNEGVAINRKPARQAATVAVSDERAMTLESTPREVATPSSAGDTQRLGIAEGSSTSVVCADKPGVGGKRSLSGDSLAGKIAETKKQLESLRETKIPRVMETLTDASQRRRQLEATVTSIEARKAEVLARMVQESRDSAAALMDELRARREAGSALGLGQPGQAREKARPGRIEASRVRTSNPASSALRPPPGTSNAQVSRLVGWCSRVLLVGEAPAPEAVNWGPESLRVGRGGGDISSGPGCEVEQPVSFGRRRHRQQGLRAIGV